MRVNTKRTDDVIKACLQYYTRDKRERWNRRTGPQGRRRGEEESNNIIVVHTVCMQVQPNSNAPFLHSNLIRGTKARKKRLWLIICLKNVNLIRFDS